MATFVREFMICSTYRMRASAVLVAGFAWSQWSDRWMDADVKRPPRPDMEGVCIGFAPGSSALDEQRSGLMTHRVQIVRPLPRDDDRHGRDRRDHGRRDRDARQRRSRH